MSDPRRLRAGLTLRGAFTTSVRQVGVPTLLLLAVAVGSASSKALKNKPSLGVVVDSLRPSLDGI